MGVAADEEWPSDASGSAVLAYRLADCEDVPFVEGPVERRASMTGRAEHNALGSHSRIGTLGVVRGNQLRHIDQGRRVSRLPRLRVYVVVHASLRSGRGQELIELVLADLQ